MTDMVGRMIVVVGPSGAGKDSIIGTAKHHFVEDDRVKFARRIITRDCDPSSEEHESVDGQVFGQMQRDGRFAVHWEAHGLSYGIPMETHALIQKGCVVVANGSRRALGLFNGAYPHLTVVNVTAQPEVLAKRLNVRGRESASAIQARLQRDVDCEIVGRDVVTIDNSGALEVAAKQFAALIKTAL